MTKKIFLSILSAVISVLLLSLLAFTAVLYGSVTSENEQQLKNELDLAVQGVEMNGEEFLHNLKSNDYRITLIAIDGTVLYDTKSTTSMENHAEREEVKEAFESGYGESERYSDTFTERTVYTAKRLTDGNVLRISTRLDSVLAIVLQILLPIIFITAFAIILSVRFARSMSREIVRPLEKLDLDHPDEGEIYDELVPIVSKINLQKRQIIKSAEELKQRTDEFDQITAFMSEALVLLDKKGNMLTMNTAAKRLFLNGENTTKRDFINTDKSGRMNKAIENALEGKNSEFREEKNGLEHQFRISRIESDGRTIGAVVLAFDVSEAAFAERNRREFTANVSHELKTPLQSIIGSAELLENGLVKPEDTERFVGHIKNEAVRLVSLINDIIGLSQLDENSEAVKENVNLTEVANEVILQLSDSAASRNITLELKGKNVFLHGVKRYLYEIIYNLLDNAIRYNKDGGKATVTISTNESSTVLTVSDTGIGIPIEDRTRIFERFYRVDKSHSKETGGTGLGLSIVKHAVAYHGGRIELDSTLTVGTTVRIIFE